MTLADAARASLSLLTVAPVRTRVLDRRSAGGAMLFAPVVGASIGAVAAGAVILLRALVDVDGSYNLLGAAIAVGVVTLASRGLHLDGLADTADALGSYRDAAGAADIMKRGDVGPFGISALVITLLLQVGGVVGCLEAHRATEGLVVGAMAGGLAVTTACVGVPAARPDGLGALVAQSVRRWEAVLMAAGCFAVAAVAGSIDEASGVHGSLRAMAALAVGVALARLFLRHAVRRLGGVSGDVFGALVEVAMTATLLAVAVLR